MLYYSITDVPRQPHHCELFLSGLMFDQHSS